MNTNFEIQKRRIREVGNLVQDSKYFDIFKIPSY